MRRGAAAVALATEWAAFGAAMCGAVMFLQGAPSSAVSIHAMLMCAIGYTAIAVAILNVCSATNLGVGRQLLLHSVNLVGTALIALASAVLASWVGLLGAFLSGCVMLGALVRRVWPGSAASDGPAARAH